MSTNINWANPVFDVKTSQNYLARLQEFLATQQPGGSNSTSNDNNKRKAPSTADDVDTAAAIKDRKHGASRSIDHATHSHTKEGSSERESPEVDEKDGKARSGKGSTSDKRKEQNRNAQRAFRERKEKVLRDLEGQISELQKANETTVSENQNLKEMITRLQEENAKLRQTTSAPQSDFTFSVPSASSQTTAPAFAAPASTASKGPSNPASYNNNDIMTFLSSNPTPPQPTQTPFTMINPSPPPNNNHNANPTNMNSIDDFMMNWNSSAFGTELPQAVPPSVTNLTEQPADTDFASLWNSLNQGNTSTFATVPSQETRQQNLADNSNFFSLFQNAFTPSLDGQAPASNTNPSFSQYVNSANTAPYNTQSVQNMAASLFPFANASASSSASPSNASNGNPNTNLQHQNSMNSTRNGSSADSPETCASSTSGGSDPSDAQPSTPNNGQALFGNNNNNKAKSKSGDSVQSLYPDIGLTSFNTSNLSNNNTGSTFEAMFGNNGFGSATTPSGVFDMMNYRDPLLGNLNDAPASGDAFNFGSFIPGNGNVSGSSAGVNNNKRSDTLDFSDFLVASPPSTTQSPPVTGSFFQMPGNSAKESNSSSSLPTLGSLSNGPSPVSTQPSPQTSLNTASTSTGNTSANGTPTWLPYDIPYSHPLIQHVMKGQVNKDKQDFENGMQSIPRQNSTDIDGLCSDMQMKATCKEHARERIAAALQTDEQTMKLYNEYLASAGQNLQQTPSPNVNYTNSA